MAHLPGQGKYHGMTGALLVEAAQWPALQDGQRPERCRPPPATADWQHHHLPLQRHHPAACRALPVRVPAGCAPAIDKESCLRWFCKDFRWFNILSPGRTVRCLLSFHGASATAKATGAAIRLRPSLATVLAGSLGRGRLSPQLGRRCRLGAYCAGLGRSLADGPAPRSSA